MKGCHIVAAAFVFLGGFYPRIEMNLKSILDYGRWNTNVIPPPTRDERADGGMNLKVDAKGYFGRWHCGHIILLCVLVVYFQVNIKNVTYGMIMNRRTKSP